MTMYAQTYVLLMAVIIGFWQPVYFPESSAPEQRMFFGYKVREIEGNKKQDYCRNLRINGYLLDRSRDIVSYLICSNGNEWIFTPYQIDDPYSIYVMTYGEYYLLILVGGYIATMFCAALTMLVTVKMHTPNLAVCIPFSCFV